MDSFPVSCILSLLGIDLTLLIAAMAWKFLVIAVYKFTISKRFLILQHQISQASKNPASNLNRVGNYVVFIVLLHASCV